MFDVGVVLIGAAVLTIVIITAVLAIKKGIHVDLAAEHEVLSCLARFGDHSNFTQSERVGCLLVTIMSGFWSTFLMAWFLTYAGVANGFPEPQCDFWSFPGVNVDWGALPSAFNEAEPWTYIQKYQPSFARLVTMVLTHFFTIVWAKVNGIGFMTATYKGTAFGNKGRQMAATAIKWFWILSGVMYFIFAGELVIHRTAASPVFMDGCTLQGGTLETCDAFDPTKSTQCWSYRNLSTGIPDSMGCRMNGDPRSADQMPALQPRRWSGILSSCVFGACCEDEKDVARMRSAQPASGTKLVVTMDIDKKMGHCEGDCDVDTDCMPGLKCVQRNGKTVVPGCIAGGPGDVKDYDYCSRSTHLINKAAALIRCTPSKKCGQCDGDCDDDTDCMPGLKCFQRNDKTVVPGCVAGGPGDVKDYDYCYGGTHLINKGGSGCTSSKKCGQCDGDCDDDTDCMPGLKCFQRNGKTVVPGCVAGGPGDVKGYDYCSRSTHLVNKGGSGCTSSKKCGQCDGDCDGDTDCMPGLKCFQRNDKTVVPGCIAGGPGDVKGYDYCYSRYRSTPSTNSTKLVVTVDIDKKMGHCEGDCDVDTDCMPGLKCVQRNGKTVVPGCIAGGPGDVKGYDYCSTFTATEEEAKKSLWRYDNTYYEDDSVCPYKEIGQFLKVTSGNWTCDSCITAPDYVPELEECDEPMGIFKTACLAPIYVLVVGWIFVGPYSYILGRLIGVIKKNTQPLLWFDHPPKTTHSITDQFVLMGTGGRHHGKTSGASMAGMAGMAGMAAGMVLGVGGGKMGKKKQKEGVGRSWLTLVNGVPRCSFSITILNRQTDNLHGMRLRCKSHL
eukprot:COSAG01_NODE_1788_length_9229_cov_55.522125_4_plen_833_part_00